MTLFFPQFLLPFDKVCQLYALVLQSSMRGNVEMAINKLVFFVLALGQTFMGIDPVLVAVESGSKFSYSRSYILDLALRYKSCSLNYNWSWILYYFFCCKRCYLDRDNYISDSFLLRWILKIFSMHNSFICLLLLFLITGYDQLILFSHLSFSIRINKDVITIVIIIILDWKHFPFKANDEYSCYCDIGLIVMCASCSGKPSLLSYLQYQLILSPEVSGMKWERP